ncbi:hypothetical protein ACP4OV_012400 [Aristida adscensionis]
MAARQSPLRRWKRFLPAFGAIDAAVEVSDSPAARRTHGEIRRVRAQIVDELRGAPDDGAAEELCKVLDDVMAESLVTLRVLPVTATALASTDLAGAVGALAAHESARIRGLARDIVRGWRASVEGDIARAEAAMDALDKLAFGELLPSRSVTSVVAHARSSHVPVAAGDREKKMQAKGASRMATKTTSATSSSHVGPAKIDNPVKVSAPLANKNAPVAGAGSATKEEMLPPKKTPAVPVSSRGGERAESDKMVAAKRKLHEGYQEAAEAKQRRKIQVIEAPKMVEQRQRKMHPIIRERSQARYTSSMAVVKRSLIPALQGI